MYQFTVRTLLGLVAILSVSLALTRFNFLYGAVLMVAFVIVVVFVGCWLPRY